MKRDTMQATKTGFRGGLGWSVLAMVGLLAACGDEVAAPGVSTDTTVPVDTSDAATDATGSDTDDTDDTDAVTPPPPDTGLDTVGGSGATGDICRENQECASNTCFRFDPTFAEGFCTDFCATADQCPSDDFDCVFFQNSAGDVARICVSKTLCFDRDEDGYGVGPGCRGPDCDDANPAINPGADELCDGLDNDCDGFVDDNAVRANTPCDTAFPGICGAGLYSCDGGLLACIPSRTAQQEICDAVDNDCDGTIDEGEVSGPLAVACYNGPAETLGVGACVGGTRTCGDGTFTDCVGQVLPFAETCDGVDNDCDGEIDEGLPGTGDPCDVPGATGICRPGRTACSSDGRLLCLPERASSEELCNGLDDDCDGSVDEGNAGGPLARACYAGDPETRDVGVCVAGVETCVDAEFGACIGDILPGPEACDSLDNDCDGDVDEGDASGGFACSTGLLGACSRGLTVCTDEGTSCEPEFAPTAEICDGIDNDCDGNIDEGTDGAALRETCYEGPDGTLGNGVCISGSRTCVGGRFGSCVGEVRPTPERCDGIDNDCDADVDEGNPESGAACTTGAPGLCAVGRETCEDGDLVCEQTVLPVAEVCDGLDNSCSGTIDRDASGQPLARTCYDGPAVTRNVGLCRDGSQVCGPGGFGGCLGQTTPATEICDGRDNDCDGEIDEGNPGGDVVCETGQPGACGVGRSICRDGALACDATTASSAELCDGRDNDCDGRVDEDASGTGRPLARSCYDGPAGTSGRGICEAGVQTCVGGEFGTCVGQQGPRVETCDGVDEDCDGNLDNGNPGGGIACTAPLPGVCAAGRTACSGGGIACQPTILPGSRSEICDGIDNDCDGTVDEGFANLGTPCFAGSGLCRRAGVTVCNVANRSGPPVCDAVPGAAGAETCDYNDDDCDGTVDEGFAVSGRYGTVAHCGGCGISCNNLWPGGPAAFNVVPNCTGTTPRCGFSCVGNYIDADGVAENGCEFLPEPTTVYVARGVAGASDGTTCGAWNTPCASISVGITRASTRGANRVRVATGVYRENLTIPNGISVLGGHNPANWTRNADVNVTVITGFTPSPVNADRIAVRLENISATTEFSGFTVNGENAAAGGNSIAVFVRNATNALTIRDNRIFGGTGGNGVVGAAGASGAQGVNGSPGTTGRIDACGGASIAGGAGGARLCGGSSAGGGAGGTSQAPVFGVANGGGANGSGPSAGAGGIGGTHFDGNVGGCTVATGATIDPEAGRAGNPGNDAGGGAGAASAVGSVVAGLWRGAAGAAGGNGGQGSGGGGGGSAPGVNATTFDGQCYYAASGGGGGSGGCGGSAGQAGTAGGGSFALYITFDSRPANDAQMPVVTGNRLSRGNGGVGGAGGTGGAGGDAGLGALGGVRNPAGTFGFCMFNGAVGAQGGRGGHAGGGGGGAGGVSYDIFVFNTNGRAPGYSANNTFELGLVALTGGLGGTGGNASNTAVGLGTSGVNGASGTLRLQD